MSHSAIGILFRVEQAGRRPEQAPDPLIPYCQGPSSMPKTQPLENGRLVCVGRFSSPQEASKQHGRREMESSRASPGLSDYSVNGFVFFSSK